MSEIPPSGGQPVEPVPSSEPMSGAPPPQRIRLVPFTVEELKHCADLFNFGFRRILTAPHPVDVPVDMRQARFSVEQMRLQEDVGQLLRSTDDLSMKCVNAREAWTRYVGASSIELIAHGDKFRRLDNVAVSAGKKGRVLRKLQSACHTPLSAQRMMHIREELDAMEEGISSAFSSLAYLQELLRQHTARRGDL